MSERRNLMIANAGGETPIDGETGVWIKSGTAVLSSAMTMTGATVPRLFTQYVYSRGVAIGTQAGFQAGVTASNGGTVISCSVIGAHGGCNIYTNAVGVDCVVLH